MQKEKIELEKSLRPKLTIISRSDRRYELRNESSGENVALKIWFANTDSIPEVGDIFYISENIIKGIRGNLRQYSFSGKHGEIYARQPHDFHAAPQEFLIVEYADGKTVLFEQWYG